MLILSFLPVLVYNTTNDFPLFTPFIFPFFKIFTIRGLDDFHSNLSLAFIGFLVYLSLTVLPFLITKDFLVKLSLDVDGNLGIVCF